MWEAQAMLQKVLTF